MELISRVKTEDLIFSRVKILKNKIILMSVTYPICVVNRLRFLLCFLCFLSMFLSYIRHCMQCMK